jgi:hypothetical protein
MNSIACFVVVCWVLVVVVLVVVAGPDDDPVEVGVVTATYVAVER